MSVTVADSNGAQVTYCAGIAYIDVIRFNGEITAGASA
jgi:hypothetical protein